MEPMNAMGQMAANWGLGVTLAVGLAVYLAWLSKQMVDMQKLIMTQAEKREERLAVIINSSLTAIQIGLTKHDDRAAAGIKEINDTLKIAREDSQRQGGYVRDEHAKQIDILNGILVALKDVCKFNKAAMQ